MLYDACLYDIYLHILEYLHDEFFVKLNFGNFFKTKSGVVMGPALSSLVALQVVVTTSGAARGDRVGFLSIVQC